MPDIADGEVAFVQGSAAEPYELKNVGGVYSCSCPAWRNAGGGIERRTCKHLRKYRGEEAEAARLAAFGEAPPAAARAKSSGGGGGRAVKKDTAPPVLLAHRWENDVDLTGWWMSEKLDGVRAWWNGEEFLSRNGNVFHAPDWFVEALPKHPLDGELWVGRKMFQDTMSVVRRFDKSDDWKKVRYVLFDAPEVNGGFEARIEFLQKAFARGKYEYTHVLEQEKVRDMKHLKEELARIEGLGGEGLMVRKPGSKYVNGRSDSLLKIKSFFDAEAKVVGHTAGTGRHKGRLGAVDVVLPDGTKFQVGTGFSDAEREDPPPIGSIITFRYQELSDGGVPRFPSYVGIREDVDWPGEKSAKPAKADPARKSVNPVNPTSAAKPKATPVSRKNEAAVPNARKANEEAPAMTEKRRFEFSEGSSNKFWEISVSGKTHTVTYGRIGTDGQSKTKSFPNPAAAQKDADELIEEKTKKGYEEVSGGGALAADGGDEEDEELLDDEDERGAAGEDEEEEDDEDEDEEEEEEEEEDEDSDEDDGGGGGKRYFEFVEGSSSKFWEIWMEGGEVYTRYGKIGAKGQVTVKDQGSPDAAKKLYDKLIKEKTGKGYEEK